MSILYTQTVFRLQNPKYLFPLTPCIIITMANNNDPTVRAINMVSSAVLFYTQSIRPVILSFEGHGANLSFLPKNIWSEIFFLHNLCGTLTLKNKAINSLNTTLPPPPNFPLPFIPAVFYS